MSTGNIEPSPSSRPGSAGSQTSDVTIPNGAPNFGTLVPNRVFVGGISSNTTESELHQLFSEFGNVKQTKIIADRAGVSKGYGFITFETEEEARRLQQAEADNIMLKERKLNIAPAFQKQQPFVRQYEMGQPPMNGALYYHNGVPYTYQNGMAMFTVGPDGQPKQVGGTLVPTTNTATPTGLFPLPDGGGNIPSPAVYHPTPSLGSATAAASLTQQQFQFQTVINNVAPAQNQSPSSGVSAPAAAAGWRWITPQTSTASSCHGQQPVAVAAATGPGHANPGAPHLTTQTFNYTLMPTTPNQQLAMMPSDSCVELPTSSPMIFSVNTTPAGYPPGTPVYHPSTPVYQLPTPSYQPSTPVYQQQMPVDQPSTPMLMSQPSTPGYQPVTAQQGSFIFDTKYIPTEDLEKSSATLTPEHPKSPTEPPTRRLDFASSRSLGTTSFKKGLERGVRKDPCRGGCFACPNDPPAGAASVAPSNDGDQARKEVASPAKNKTPVLASNQCLVEAGMEGGIAGAGQMKGPVDGLPPGAGGGQMEGWSGGVPGVQQMEMPRQFVYPGPGYYNYPGPGYYNNVPLAPLTPITPSVDPALGFKTGYIEPQTPNPMTPNQFYYYCQASPFPYSPMDGAPEMSYQQMQGQPIRGQSGQTIQGHPGQTLRGQPDQPMQGHPVQSNRGRSLSQSETVQLSQPPPGKSLSEMSQGGAFTFLKPAAKKSRSYIENNNYSGNNRNNGPYNNNTSYFTSPFKTFTNFRGTPSPTRFPLRSPNYRPAHAARMNVNRRTNKRNMSVTSPQDNANPGAETGTDTKANWYKAGERFGVSSTFQKRNKSVDNIPSDLTSAPSIGMPMMGLTPPQTPLSAAEPDLIAGQMRNISLK